MEFTLSFDLKLKNGDISLNNGDLTEVVDGDKLIQSVLKICLTEAGSNPLNPWYGSFISKNLIGSALDNTLLVQIAQSQLQLALENLKNIQISQVKSFQKITADEQISSILGISVVRNQIDPRLFDINISILTKGLKPIKTGFTVNPL